MQKVGLNSFQASLASTPLRTYLMTMSMKVLCKVKGDVALEDEGCFSPLPSFVVAFSGGDDVETGDVFSDGLPRV